MQILKDILLSSINISQAEYLGLGLISKTLVIKHVLYHLVPTCRCQHDSPSTQSSETASYGMGGEDNGSQQSFINLYKKAQ